MIISKILSIKKVLGLGIYCHPETLEMTYQVMLIQKKKDELTLLFKKELSDINELIELSIKTDAPIVVVYDGKGVLNKRIDVKNDQDVAWRKNVDFESVYFTAYATESEEYISLCRKNIIDEVYEQIKKLPVFEFYIGPFLGVLLKESISEDSYNSNEVQLEFEKDKLVRMTKKSIDDNIEYSTGQESLSPFQLPVYGSVINAFIELKEINNSSLAHVDKTEFIYKKMFNLAGIIMLVVFFLALLASYLLSNYFISKNASLYQENLYSTKTLTTINQLEEEKQKKMKILGETGQMSKKFISYYSFELASSVPPQIKLNNLDVFTVDEIKQDKKVAINSKKIMMSGSFKNEEIFQQWLTSIQKMKWIKTFEVLSIKKDKYNVQWFELKIISNDF